MSTESELRQELEKERRKREEVEQKLNASLNSENYLREENNHLRQELAVMTHVTNEKKHNVPGRNEATNREAITELYLSQLSPSASSHGRGANNSGSSPSFEIIERSSPVHLQKGKESPTSNLDSDPQSGSLKSSQQRPARVPVQSSVQHDSRLTFRPAQREGSPQDLDKVNSSRYDVTQLKGTFEKGDLSEANSWPQQSDPWNGTGARPKNNSFPTSNPQAEDSERNPRESEGQLSPAETDPKVSQKTKMLVKIPKDGGSYRINHHPPNNYGQDISMTGISSIFTSNEDETRVTPKQTGFEAEALELNDLNSASPRSSDKSLSPRVQLINKGNADTLLNVQSGTKDLQEQEMLLMSFTSPYQSVNPKNVTGQLQVSSEDDINLASQLNSLVLEMRSKVLNTEECLDKFSSYAEEVDKLEIRLKEYQAQIQKHQVFSSSLQANSAEVQQLRMDNEELRQLLQQYTVLSSGPESGWVSVANVKESKQEETKELQEELKNLTALNNQLFSVNKQWEESWKIRESQFTAQHEDLDNKRQKLMKENEQLKEQTQEVSQLKEELKTLKHEKHELAQRTIVQESHLLKEQKMNSKMKAKWDVYNNAKGDMEIQVRDLMDKIKELKTNNGVLKEQVKTAIEDFNQEQKEKTRLEDQVKKLMAEKSGAKEKKHYEGKLKSAELIIKKREEELYVKDKNIGDLQRTIDDLNAKLRTAERRTVLQPPSLFQSVQSADVFCPSASPAYNPNQMKVLQEQNKLTENPGAISYSPLVRQFDEKAKVVVSAEHSPESWTCPHCTFVNFAYAKRCEMCDSAKMPDNSMLASYSTLHSRDEWPGRDVPDMMGQINVN